MFMYRVVVIFVASIRMCVLNSACSNAMIHILITFFVTRDTSSACSFRAHTVGPTDNK